MWATHFQLGTVVLQSNMALYHMPIKLTNGADKRYAIMQRFKIYFKVS